ncbi:helix-turn-helix transcriptional regulator [Spongiimicrobium sp. 2-473A-2-J]|uniref:helix-turn-helix transcriptional regulator n=1 Tax=Eudoraea algarum TaxID=3417568 RepID=UPI003D36692B
MINRIKEYRKINNFSQQKLASILNISRQTLSNIKNQKQVPSLIIGLKLSRVFSVDVNGLFQLKP